MKQLGIFPFGQPVLPLVQKDRTKKRVFVLGVYASAVHATWIGPDERQKIAAMAVASEPEIFWTGDDADTVISSIKLPAGAGRLVPAKAQFNGPSGRALKDEFLTPLGLPRKEVWLCDLVPYSCMNPSQKKALQREYDPVSKALGLPEYQWSPLPSRTTDEARRAEIENELLDSGADTLITLGEPVLKWFTRFYGSAKSLSDYGATAETYGRLQPLTVRGRKINLLPLAHPRQAAALGTHSAAWLKVHKEWKDRVAEHIFQ